MAGELHWRTLEQAYCVGWGSAGGWGWGIPWGVPSGADLCYPDAMGRSPGGSRSGWVGATFVRCWRHHGPGLHPGDARASLSAALATRNATPRHAMTPLLKDGGENPRTIRKTPPPGMARDGPEPIQNKRRFVPESSDNDPGNLSQGTP